jgi:uncharacterized protein (DUF433 family)
MNNFLSTKKTHNLVQINSEVRFGKPVIAGTRIAVEDILNLLQSGYRIDEIPGQYEGLDLLKVKEAVQFATSLLGNEETLSISA